MKNLERLNRARVRARVRRILASREETEHEGGELNLVPYLDILVNTIIFLLATTVSVVPLAHVRTDAPHYAPPPRHADRPSPAPPPEGLNLTVDSRRKKLLTVKKPVTSRKI